MSMNDNDIFPLNPGYKEILKLHEMLEAENIPHGLCRYYDGYAVCYPDFENACVCDAVEHRWSYGSNEDLIEILGLAEDDLDIEGASIGRRSFSTNQEALRIYKIKVILGGKENDY